MKEYQLELFRALKNIKDLEVDLSDSYLNNPRNSSLNKEYKLLKQKLITDEEISAFKKVQNETIECVIYRILEMIDGYGDLSYDVELINKNNNESVRGNIELHDQFINYIYDRENEK
ncbi:hypothetical protein CN692_22165 [Bacillus sp. AFS002410]|uniref:hypothetical protein n=1 Tax=Bacillus sp. AFS002410 TaxID=2033481 RepID=UPI000BF21776|nr:hypothetical protein [Bacillus sp. AFS002410]PEJ52094.1 hypothetical protein CN692_22165 [Bacillus sp. AFS002410]